MSNSVLCIGATLIDELYFCEDPILPSTSNPAKKASSIGGVISNIVQHLALLDLNVSLITALGTDNDAKFIQSSFENLHISLNNSIIVDDTTGKYVSILNTDGSLYVSVCQDISFKYITIQFLESKIELINQFEVIIIDTNLDTNVIQWIINFSNKHKKTLIIEPVSVSKAAKLANLDLAGVFMITPNEDELVSITSAETKDELSLISSLQKRGVKKIWLTKGSQGSVIYDLEKSAFLPVPLIPIIDSTGAGDAALAGWIFGYLNKENELICHQLGHTLAFEILKIKGTVDFTIDKQKLRQLKQTYYDN